MSARSAGLIKLKWTNDCFRINWIAIKTGTKCFTGKPETIRQPVDSFPTTHPSHFHYFRHGLIQFFVFPINQQSHFESENMQNLLIIIGIHITSGVTWALCSSISCNLMRKKLTCHLIEHHSTIRILARLAAYVIILPWRFLAGRTLFHGTFNHNHYY